MRSTDTDLEKFLQDYPMLRGWSLDTAIRSLPRDRHKKRLSEPHSIKEFLNILKMPDPMGAQGKPSFLFAHFSPFEYEMEALGLPSYARKKFPASTIHLTYDKGNRDVHRFAMDDNCISPIKELNSDYDLIIARSSVLKSMASRTHDASVIKNSDLKVNIKTMSLKSNMILADHYFHEEEMCPPPDPFYMKKTSELLSRYKKKNLIVVSGTLWYVKNQLKMFSQLDPKIIENFKVVIIGGERDIVYANKIREICESKKIDYYMIGWVCKELAHEITTLSKISIIPQDQRPYGQPKGYPRIVGESIGARCITLCNAPITIPDFYRGSCFQYNHDKGDFNEVLKKCMDILRDENYLNLFEWSPYTMENLCEEVLTKCINYLLRSA